MIPDPITPNERPIFAIGLDTLLIGGRTVSSVDWEVGDLTLVESTVGPAIDGCNSQAWQTVAMVMVADAVAGEQYALTATIYLNVPGFTVPEKTERTLLVSAVAQL